VPAREIDPDALPEDGRKELFDALSGPAVLAEPETGVGIGWMLLATLGGGCLAAFAVGGLGIVTSSYKHHGLWVAALWALAAATALVGVIWTALAIKRRMLPWRAGRFLLRRGFFDARKRPILTRPLAELTRYEVGESSGSEGPLRLFTISLWFGDEVERFQIFGLPHNVPRAALDELQSAAEEARASDKSRGMLGMSSPVASRGGFALSAHPWKTLIVLALALVAPVELWVLPALSVQAAERMGTVWSLRAAAAAYPRASVIERVTPQIRARYDAARAAVERKAAPERRALLTRLLSRLEESGSSVVRVRLVTPPEEDTKAATAAIELVSKISPGTTPAPVVLHYQSVSLAGHRAGESELAGALSSRFEAALGKHDVIEIQAAGDLWGASKEAAAPSDPAPPEIEIVSRAQFGNALQGEGARVYASLSFTFEAWLSLPGEPRALLAERVTVPAPESLEVSRFRFEGEKAKPLGGSGDPIIDRLDDSLIYVKQATSAASAGAKLIGDQIFGSASGKVDK
jgi:hypothetical protein